MERSQPAQSPYAAARERRTSSELAKLVRKLRWIGMEEEAEKLSEELARRASDAVGVIAPSRETD